MSLFVEFLITLFFILKTKIKNWNYEFLGEIQKIPRSDEGSRCE